MMWVGNTTGQEIMNLGSNPVSAASRCVNLTSYLTYPSPFLEGCVHWTTILNLSSLGPSWGLAEAQTARHPPPPPQGSDSAGLRICISSRFQVMLMLLDQGWAGGHSENLWARRAVQSSVGLRGDRACPVSRQKQQPLSSTKMETTWGRQDSLSLLTSSVHKQYPAHFAQSCLHCS